MPSPIVMPRLGLSMVEGTVTEWKVRPGDAVEAGQPILVIESEKAEVEIEAFASGVVGTLYVDVGSTVPIGALLGAIVAEGETFDADAFANAFVPDLEGAPATAGERSEAKVPAPAASAAAPVASRGGPAKVAPAARALAKKLGVDLGRVRGSGPGGRILPEDVERSAAAAGDRGELDHEIVGTGPAILFVCGYGVDRHGWRRQVEGLSTRFTVATYDHRGVGDSSPLVGLPAIADLADDAAALARRLGLTAATVVGASMGAAVAIELALRHPEAVGRLVCLAPVVRPNERFAAVLRAWSDTTEPESEIRIRNMLPWLLGRDFLAVAGKRAAAAAALRAMAARTPPETLRGHAEALLEWLGTGEKHLPGIACPTLVVAGEDDWLTPLDQARALAAAIPNARLEIVVGAGHALMVERPDAVNAAIASFSS